MGIYLRRMCIRKIYSSFFRVVNYRCCGIDFDLSHIQKYVNFAVTSLIFNRQPQKAYFTNRHFHFLMCL